MDLNKAASGWLDLWKPPDRLPLSQWSEKHISLSPEYSARTGPLRLYGWQRGILDSFSDPTVETICLMVSTQMIKTLFLQLACAYVICETPAPALLVQFKEDDINGFAKERLGPMIRDNPILSKQFPNEGKKDPYNTFTFKRFPSGSLALVGAGSPANAARRSICYAFLDEIDKYDSDVGGEGDFIDLVRERTTTFGSRRKIVMVCSPTSKHTSRIGRAYEQSDQRKPYVQCWKCGEWQILKWAQVRWDNRLARHERHLTARYECEICSAHWNDVQRLDACERADWRAHKPFIGTAGFWISHLYRKKVAEMVRDFLKAKESRTSLKVFTMTNLAELWEDEGETPEWEKLMGRREQYTFGSEPALPNTETVVPMRVRFLTAFVDLQEDRLEYEVTGWAPGKESWSIAYGVIQVVDPLTNRPYPTSMAPVWTELDKVLATDWAHESGGAMPIMVMGIDTGFRPKPVYDFALRHVQPAYGPGGIKVHSPRTVVPTKGSSTETLRLLAAVSKEDAARKRQGVRIVSIGTAFAKQELFDNLRLPRATGDETNPGYCHFPEYGEDYFRGLCSEKRVVHDDDSVSYEKIFPRNEPLDCRVGNRAMASVFGIDRFNGDHWRKLEQSLGIDLPPEPLKVDPAPPASGNPQPKPNYRPNQPARRVIRSPWMG